MKAELIFCLAFTLCIAFTSSSIAADTLPAKCVSEDCFRIAEPVVWPEMKPVGGISSHLGPFNFLLPEKVKHFGVSSINPVFSVEYSQGHFIFEMIRKQEIKDFIGQSMETSTMRLIDYPAVMFKKTPASPMPEDQPSKHIWRWIFDLKRAQLKGADSVFYSVKDNFTAYYTKGSVLGWDCYAIITSSDYPDFYMTIQGFNRDMKDLNYILSSLSYNQE